MNPTPLDPNAELRAAQEAVQQRQHHTAITHLCRLLPQFPTQPLVTALLDELIATAPDPLQLVPKGPVEYGAGALQAYALGRAGRAGDAYGLLRQLAHANPRNGIIDWALPWLDAGQLPDEQRAEAVSLYFVSAHSRFGLRKDLPPDAVAVVKRWLPHVRTVMANKPYTDPLYTAYIPMLRQAGEMDEAVRVCAERHRAAGTYESAVSLASTYREARRFEEWLAASEEILRLAPDDVPARLDLGDCYWEDQGKLEEAERWYADTLRLEPHQAWAKPSLLAVQYLRTNDPRFRDELEDYAAAQPGNERAGVCLDRVTPFFAVFLYPADGSVNNMNGIANQIEPLRSQGNELPSGTIRSTSSVLDVPSCRRSIDRQLELWGGTLKLEREILGVQSPDPREPRGPVRYRLWTYDGFTPVPAVPPGPPEFARAVAQLAGVRYDLGLWVEYAGQIGQALTRQFGEATVSGLLGVMGNPPDPPPGVRAWDWTARVQFAAALILAGGGPSTFEVLTDLVNGPLDWATAAAVVALTALAQVRPEFAPRVRQLFAGAYADLPRPGADYYENVILNCHLRLPNVPPEERAAVRAARAQFEARARKRMTEAESAASLFVKRPVPPGAEQFELVRMVIEAYLMPEGRAHSAFATGMETALAVAESGARAAQGEAKAYLDEQLRVVRLIQKEIWSNAEELPLAEETP